MIQWELLKILDFYIFLFGAFTGFTGAFTGAYTGAYKNYLC